MGRLVIDKLDADGLRPFESQLHALERDITYPIEDGADRFWIDHGASYPAFFTQMGTARFFIARDDDELLGIGVVVRRSSVGMGGVPLPLLYLADLKLKPSARGRGILRDAFQQRLKDLLTERAFWGWQFLFGAAMRDTRGDVRRSFKGASHPGKLGTQFATLRLFFAAPRDLRAIVGDGPTTPRTLGLDLGTVRSRPMVETTSGRKDLRLISSGQPWPLHHLPLSPVEWGRGLGAMLRDAGQRMPDDAIACFSLDERLVSEIAYLDALRFRSETRCTIIGLPGLPMGPAAWLADWVHLPTSEI